MTVGMKKVGFIGLGDMGKPMAETLVKAGFDVTVYDLVKERVDALEKMGARSASSPRQIAATCDVIISMVRDNPQTEEVVFGKNGVWEGVKEGSIIIITSTIDPIFYEKIGPKAKEAGVGILDAPVSGGRMGAAAGTLTLMVGGDERLFQECMPILKAMGQKIYYQGGLGTGQMAKLVNNAILYMNRAAATEGIALGLGCGLKLERVIELVTASTGNSWAVQHWDLFRTIDRKLMRKTMGLALDLAKRQGVHMPMLGFVSQLPTTSEEIESFSKGQSWPL